MKKNADTLIADTANVRDSTNSALTNHTTCYVTFTRSMPFLIIWLNTHNMCYGTSNQLGLTTSLKATKVTLFEKAGGFET